MSSTVLGLVRASHPEPVAAVTAVAGLLAWGVGHRPAGIAAVALTVLASQLAVGWSNDLIDADRDATVGRTDKPVVAGAVRRRTLGLAVRVAVPATLLLALTTNRTAALCATVGLGAGLLYNWPLKATPLSVLPYAVSFGALPAFVVLALPGAPPPPYWLVGAAALLGAGAHFANVLPDLADDARTGVRGLPHRLGPAGSRAAAAGLLLAATVALVVGPPGPPSWAGLSAVAAAILVPVLGWYASRAAARGGGRPVAAFRAVMVVALIDVVLLVASGRVI
ncbi:4-hydroxybenzoate polyprenyltransferase [Micromonospora rhizosphaerae]|uniref:4-hydroxybenzoate polyprenyltransferase n=1 Tax=Micromonospora rhizosphaerae TaxID=568872 RepID=A0A1C6RBS8_9ACTN|nr:UbiA family prenyltransferase [Micromonospora rhizosphaerae]SCL14608.1 4-hydroxybenzoate polyprenyltransferase [Micromonospora rhizosphaerae]